MVLEVKNLCFSYSLQETIYNISFNVQRGELVCLLGANGSGKTTILKCLNGILKPHQGEISIDEDRLSRMKQREIARYISMVPQDYPVTFSYSVIDIVTMGITPYLAFGRMPVKKDYRRAESILNLLKIKKLASKRYDEISGGERKLVLIARALMQNTDFLIMDEPNSHLDFKNQYLLLKQLKRLTQKGKGVVISLHDPNLVLKYCDKVVIIKKGRVLAKGLSEDVITELNLQYAYDIEMKIKDNIRGIVL